MYNKTPIINTVNWLILILLTISLSGCIVAERPIDNVAYYNLLSKSNEFLAFCIYMLKNEEVNIIHIIPRLYYSYFNLAKLVHTVKTKKFEQEKHDVIWLQNKKSARKLYYDFLRKSRINVDYGVNSIVQTEEEVKEMFLDKFIPNNKKASKCLMLDLEEQTDKFFKEDITDNYYIKSKEIIQEIEHNNNKLNELICNRIKTSEKKS